MLNSILVAIDDSPASRSALDVAVKLAQDTNVKLKGLFIEDVMKLLAWQPTELIGAAIGASSQIPTSKETEEQIEVEKGFIEEGNKLRKLFETKCKGANIVGHFFIQRGKIDELINEASRTVDFVVIGRRGKTYPLDSIEPGPVIENLLRITTRPVLVVPIGSVLDKKILIAYDGSQAAQRALYAGAQFAKIFNAQIRVVSVADDIDTAEKPLSEAKEFLSSYKLKASYSIEFGYGKPWKAIMEEARRFDTGLIVLGAFGSNKFMELIFGSTTREVLMQANCPVLLCR